MRRSTSSQALGEWIYGVVCFIECCNLAKSRGEAYCIGPLLLYVLQYFFVSQLQLLLLYHSRPRYDPVYGARPLKRTIQREVETVLAKRIISGDVTMGDTLVADVVNERLVISSKDSTAGISTAPPAPLT